MCTFDLVQVESPRRVKRADNYANADGYTPASRGLSTGKRSGRYRPGVHRRDFAVQPVFSVPSMPGRSDGFCIGLMRCALSEGSDVDCQCHLREKLRDRVPTRTK